MNRKGLKTIIIPIGEEDYHKIIDRAGCFKDYLDSQVDCYPEIFPISLIKRGYTLAGFSASTQKVSIKRRIIQVKHERYLVHPCFMMPYLRGTTECVSKGLELRRYTHLTTNSSPSFEK